MILRQESKHCEAKLAAEHAGFMFDRLELWMTVLMISHIIHWVHLIQCMPICLSLCPSSLSPHSWLVATSPYSISAQRPDISAQRPTRWWKNIARVSCGLNYTCWWLSAPRYDHRGTRHLSLTFWWFDRNIKRSFAALWLIFPLSMTVLGDQSKY